MRGLTCGVGVEELGTKSELDITFRRAVSLLVPLIVSASFVSDDFRLSATLLLSAAAT